MLSNWCNKIKIWNDLKCVWNGNAKRSEEKKNTELPLIDWNERWKERQKKKITE